MKPIKMTFLCAAIFLLTNFTIEDKGLEEQMAGTWITTTTETIPDAPGVTLVTQLIFTFLPNENMIAKAIIDFKAEGKSMTATAIRMAGTWKISRYSGKNYLVDDLQKCTETVNNMPEYFSLCDDLYLFGSEDDEPVEILFVNDTQMILKYEDMGAYHTMTLKKV